MMTDLSERLAKAEQLVKKESFRRNKGLGNEVGYYVFDYPAEKELLVREHITYMKNKNSRGTDGFELIVLDLYDIIIDILEAEGYLEECFKFEKVSGFERIIAAIGHLLEISENYNRIVRYIHEKTPEEAVIFLVGIGKCYPVLRSHKVLNTLHQTMERVPVVLFYPGKYDGKELVLFSSIEDDNYYRAFKLVE